MDFRRCLSALPNIHTIHAAKVQRNNDLITAFAGLRLPSVRTIRLPTHAHRVLRCCPEVRRIICVGRDDGKLLTTMKGVCKNVEVLEGFELHEKYMKRNSCSLMSTLSFGALIIWPGFVKAVPNLQDIKIRGSSSPVCSTFITLCMFQWHLTVCYGRTHLNSSHPSGRSLPSNWSQIDLSRSRGSELITHTTSSHA